MTAKNEAPIKLGLPKGRMQAGVIRLLADAGIEVRVSDRGYRPRVSIPWIEAKILKPQNIIEMLHIGSRDLGFAGADWVAELQVDLVELLNTELDPVELVAAAPIEYLKNGTLKGRRLTKEWIDKNGWDAVCIKSYGATEVFPPEDADCIIDITSTGETLRINRLQSFSTLLKSSTRLYANPRVRNELLRFLESDPTDIALRSLQNGFAVQLSDLSQAVAVVNSIAPEHLQLSFENPESLISGLRNYGALFIGERSAEVFGDYGVGPNHVLPTAAGTRRTGGLSVTFFLRQPTWLEIQESAELKNIALDSAELAKLEGLKWHARAAKARLP